MSAKEVGLKYSVIIPHYNDCDRLIRLLSSLPLNREDVEVIVVDDCSPDQVSLIQAKEKYPIVNWFSTQVNSGAGAARNVGLAHASGDWLMFADSDDQFTPYAFEVFDSCVRQDWELIYFLAEAVQEVNGHNSNRADRINDLCRSYIERPTEENLLRLKFGHVNPVSKVYSRRFICSIGLTFDEVRVANDVRFNVISALMARRVQVVPEYVYRIYRRASSLTSSASGDLFLQRVSVQAKLASELKSLGILHQISATGWMLSSIAYGPAIAWKVWVVCLTSPMKIKFGRIFHLSRWIRFCVTRWRDHVEKKTAQ